jgi:hypothetical protein
MELKWPDILTKWLKSKDRLRNDIKMKDYCVSHSRRRRKMIICLRNHLPCQSRWPRGLRQELSSPAETLRSWVRIPLEAWMSMCVYSVCAVLSVQLAALRRADPPSKESYRLCKRSRNWKVAKVQQRAVEPKTDIICQETEIWFPWKWHYSRLTWNLEVLGSNQRFFVIVKSSYKHTKRLLRCLKKSCVVGICAVLHRRFPPPPHWNWFTGSEKKRLVCITSFPAHLLNLCIPCLNVS